MSQVSNSSEIPLRDREMPFSWVTKDTVRFIRKTYRRSSKKDPTFIVLQGVYYALCEAASDRKDKKKFSIRIRELRRFTGLARSRISSALKKLTDLRVIDVCYSRANSMCVSLVAPSWYNHSQEVEVISQEVEVISQEVEPYILEESIFKDTILEENNTAKIQDPTPNPGNSKISSNRYTKNSKEFFSANSNGSDQPTQNSPQKVSSDRSIRSSNFVSESNLDPSLAEKELCKSLGDKNIDGNVRYKTPPDMRVPPYSKERSRPRKPIDPDCQAIFTLWNGQAGIAAAGLKAKSPASCAAAYRWLKQQGYELEEIYRAIIAYGKLIAEENQVGKRGLYRMTLPMFLNPKWLDRFLPDNHPLEAFGYEGGA